MAVTVRARASCLAPEKRRNSPAFQDTVLEIEADNPQRELVNLASGR